MHNYRINKLLNLKEVKVIKRISYRIRNFKHFRARILHSCN